MSDPAAILAPSLQRQARNQGRLKEGHVFNVDKLRVYWRKRWLKRTKLAKELQGINQLIDLALVSVEFVARL